MLALVRFRFLTGSPLDRVSDWYGIPRLWTYLSSREIKPFCLGFGHLGELTRRLVEDGAEFDDAVLFTALAGLIGSTR